MKIICNFIEIIIRTETNWTFVVLVYPSLLQEFAFLTIEVECMAHPEVTATYMSTVIFCLIWSPASSSPIQALDRDPPNGVPTWNFIVQAIDDNGHGLIGYADVQVSHY